MKKEHTIKNPLKKLSLQWRLTLIITLLMTVTCILMYFFISSSAVTGIEDLGDYVVKINETDSTSAPPVKTQFRKIRRSF